MTCSSSHRSADLEPAVCGPGACNMWTCSMRLSLPAFQLPCWGCSVYAVHVGVICPQAHFSNLGHLPDLPQVLESLVPHLKQRRQDFKGINTKFYF